MIRQAFRETYLTMKNLLPRIVSARVVLISLDDQLHGRLSPLIEDLYKRDARVAKLGARVITSKLGIDEIGEVLGETKDFDDWLLRESAGLFSKSEVHTAEPASRA